HSKKDPAKPTRAKAARPHTAPLDPTLADLLNPAIGQGRAGVGSQTGNEPSRGNKLPTSPRPGEHRRPTDAVVAGKNADANASAVQAQRDRVRGIEPRD